MPKKRPFWSLCVSDFFASKTCAGMTGLQEAAYLLALARCWDWDGLPVDKEEFRRRLRLEKRWFARHGGPVYSAFVISDEPGGKVLRHPRQEEQRRELAEFHRLKSEAGKAGNLKRWSQTDRIAIAQGSPPSPSPSPSLEEEKDEEKTSGFSGAKKAPHSQSQIDWNELISTWNRIAEKHGRPRIQKLTEVRKKKLRARLKECPDLFREVEAEIDKAGSIIHDGAWLTFDWLMSPANVTKLLEGNYRDRPRKDPDERPTFEDPWGLIQ